MSNRRKAKNPSLSQNVLASSTKPLMEANPNQGEYMTDNKPVEVVTDTNPDTPEDTVATVRFNRKKIAKYAAAFTAGIAALALFGANRKQAGKKEFIEDVNRANGDDPDETPES